MAKRPLGLAKAAKAKKQKAPEPEELTVELGEEVDQHDAMGQLFALWKTYYDCDDKKELVLNGIIHDCDRILRKAKAEKQVDDDEKIELSGRFYAIYALALLYLAFFHTEEPKKVDDFYSEAMDRVSSGFAAYPASLDLHFAKARIIINHVPLGIVSRLNEHLTTKEFPNVAELLDESISEWETAKELALEKDEYDCYNAENLDLLKAMDDLLDIATNFGHRHSEDSDVEEAQQEVELKESHPLYAVCNTDKYLRWWREQLLDFLDKLNHRMDLASKNKEERGAMAFVRREVCKRIGHSYLLEAEKPADVYTRLVYYEKDKKEIGGVSRAAAQKLSIALFNTALGYLEESQDDNEPELWVVFAEALISLGNVHELGSAEQEQLYKRAEEILVRANNATNGKFDDILENLLHN